MNTIWHKPTEIPAIWCGDSIIVIDASTTKATGRTRLSMHRLTASETGWEADEGEYTDMQPSDCIAWAYENDLALAVAADVLPLGEFLNMRFVTESRPEQDGEE